MTKEQETLLNEYGIVYDDYCECRGGIFDNYILYTDGYFTHVLDYGKYLQVKYTNGFWGGFFGMADCVNVKVYDETELENVLKYIETLKDKEKRKKVW